MSYLGDDFPAGTSSDPFLIADPPDGWGSSSGDWAGSGSMADPWIWKPGLPGGSGGGASGGDWSNLFAGVSSGVAGLLRAFSGNKTQPPPGFRYDNLTGRLVPITPGVYQAGGLPSWVLPVGLAAVGAILLLKK